MKKIVYLIFLVILINACDVEGGRHSTSSSNMVMSSSSVIENNSTTNFTSSSSSIFVSTGLPMSSQEFIDLVNSIDISKEDGRMRAKWLCQGNLYNLIYIAAQASHEIVNTHNQK